MQFDKFPRSICKIGILATAFTVLGILGCGGGKNNIQTGSGGTVSFSGGEATLGYTSTPTVVPATGGSTVTVAGYSGTTVVPSGIVPPGSTVGTDTPLAVIASGTGFPGNLIGGASVTVNGVSDSGATVGSNGLLVQNVAIPVTEAGTAVSMSFPAQVVDLTRSLTIQTITFSGKFYLRLSPVQIISPVPTGISGRLPNNGENAAGSSITATWSNGNNGRTAELRIDYGNGFVLRQSRVITNGRATFSDLTNDSSSVPNSGVQTVSFSIGDL